MNPIISDNTNFKSLNQNTELPLFALRTWRNSRPVFVTFITFEIFFDLVEEIKPDKPLDVNRKIDEKRLPLIGEYFLNEPEWIFPPILVDTEEELRFEPFENQQFKQSDNKSIIEGGLLYIDRNKRDFLLQDGQHRFMGNFRKYESLTNERKTAENLRIKFNNSSDLMNAQIQEQEVARLDNLLMKYKKETFTVEIITKVDPEIHKKWFVTIADEAHGINYSAKTRLDSTNTTSVVANYFARNYVLFQYPGERNQTKIEMHEQLAKKSSEQLYSLGNLRDWIKNIAWGHAEKETINKERKLNTDSLQKMTERFFNLLVSNLKIYEDIAEHRINGAEFRRLSLLSSPTILRALSATFHNLVVNVIETGEVSGTSFEVKDDGLKKFVKLLKDLEPYFPYEVVGKKVDIKQEWREIGSYQPGLEDSSDTVFRSSGIAPQSGFQERQVLINLFTKWAETGEVFNPKLITKEKRGK